jgi:hypothetical protein
MPTTTRTSIKPALSPFLTAPDPKADGEGRLDPLGLATIGDRLADRLLPGLRVRMARPRFLTAMAVCAHVCDGLNDEGSETPAYLVFEWLLVEALARDGNRAAHMRTPGIGKAQEAVDTKGRMSAPTYLRVPTVFGFNGVYKPLAESLDFTREVEGRFHLGDKGYELLRVWQEEQKLGGFLDSGIETGNGSALRDTLRSAVRDGLQDGYTDRSASWSGWTALAKHLGPSSSGAHESAMLYKCIATPEEPPREEVFRLMRSTRAASDESEADLARRRLLPRASTALKAALTAIIEFEALAVQLEEAFDWIRHLSTIGSGRPIVPAEYAGQKRVAQLTKALPKSIDAAADALDDADLQLQQTFNTLAKSFDKVRTPADLFEATLARHSVVQKEKAPDGKRDWFERAASGATFVRVPYRLPKQPVEAEGWGRPYRLTAVDSFLADLVPGR